MSMSLRIVVVVAVSALCSGDFANGQIRKKDSDAPQKAADPAKKNPVAPPAEAVPATKANDPVKKPAEANAVPAQAGDSADEKAIRDNIEKFTQLYNSHDIKGLVALFAPTAEMIDEDGGTTKGREAIEQRFNESLKLTPKSSMQVVLDSLRVVTPALAIEEGFARSKDSPDDREDVTAYIAIHVKTEGKWLLASVRDTKAPPKELSPHEHLQELAWLVGDWVEESSASVIRSSCKWHDNGNFLLQEFHVQMGGHVAMSGTMRIGWDAVRKQFKSWVFDSKGGHAEGYWSYDGDQWIVKSQGTTAAGETASATTMYRSVDDETVLWKSTDRVIDGKLQENVEPITVKRRPPSPSK